MPSQETVENQHISVQDKNAVALFARDFFQLYSVLYNPKHTPVFVCIGSDRLTGDALGPLVGNELSTSQLFPFPVYGTLAEPVHASNLSDRLNQLKKEHCKPFIIAVDASLGSAEHVGTIVLKPGPLKPGNGVNKDLPQVGEMNITGIVNVSGFMEFQVLQSTRLNLVMQLVQVISQGVIRGMSNCGDKLNKKGGRDRCRLRI